MSTTVRQFFRQHGNNATREINGCAQQRILIQCIIRCHIVADVSNSKSGDAIGAPDLYGFTVNRIIKVTRIFTINRDQRITQINLFSRSLASTSDGNFAAIFLQHPENS
jgi:hypothetical protein